MSVGIGNELRAAREEQGRTVEEAARALSVRSDFLRALEDEHFETLGGDVYAKGFLRQYATWLGLDPEPLLDRYRKQVQRADVATSAALIDHRVGRGTAQSPPGWLTWGLVTLIVLVAALAIVGLVGGRSPEPVAQPDVPETTAPEPSDTPSEGDAGGAPPPPPATPTPSPSPTGVELALLLEESSWIRVRVDDEVVFEGTVAAGETREFGDAERIALRLGNAGGVRLVLNGRPLDPVGDRGEVVDVLCTPDGCSAGA